MKCSICGYDIPVVNGWSEGHNADPINSGRCCGDCNAIYVIPERIRLCSGIRIQFDAKNEEEILHRVQEQQRKSDGGEE